MKRIGKKKYNYRNITIAVIALLVIGIGGTGLAIKLNHDQQVYAALKSKEADAEEKAKKSRKPEDIQLAQKLADELKDGDKTVATEHIKDLKSDLIKLNNASSAVDKADAKPTEEDTSLAQKLVDQLSSDYLSKDKEGLQKRLDKDKEVVAKQKEAAEAAKKAAAEAAKVAEETKGQKLIALTFDDGPNPQTTPGLLQTLKSKGVVATFFALGQQAQANPDIIKQEAAAGNEVASHTWDHKDLTTLSPGAAKQEILSAHDTINSLSGQNTNIFRPPYGSYNQSTLALTDLAAVNWSIDTNDWRYNSPAPVVQNAMSAAHPGAIILMHDIHPWSVAAVPQIIDQLKAQGYTFVTVTKLLEARDGGVQAHQVYFGQ
ncbi:polysaccharide deacetylase family protein [Lactococcus termiticola]|uniref:Xylanase/chitin deacetylase n=1 Tax=Lactococcus termiticola TaxID=2169526 RepID=A0A2R5HJE2_9LACT|nr:polysaccharide deacetylase family protein [Lactococcus termiticola]GBG96690.1 xylanase/chitin deacetylase [Lactococcus termiticola]